jgi:AraC-like DNA-binding protein
MSGERRRSWRARLSRAARSSANIVGEKRVNDERHRASYPARDDLVGSARDGLEAQAQWVRFVARNFGHFAIEIKKESTFRVQATSRAADEFMVIRLTTQDGKAKLQRCAREIGRDCQDRYALYMPMAGEQEIIQLNRASRCMPGALTVVSMAESLEQTKFGNNDTIYYFMPRTFVEQRMVWPEKIRGRTIDARGGVWRLVAETLLALQQNAHGMSDGQFAHCAHMLGDLIMFAASDCRDTSFNPSSARASHLARVKRTILARLTETELSLSDIARECALSLRYTHDLFRDDGRTMREYIQGERLQLARHLLETGDPCSTSITEVGFACGFSNASHFSTAFRRAFGVSPRDVLHGAAATPRR